MAVNRFYQRTPYDIGLYVPPVEVLAETMKMNQEKFDRNYLLIEELKNHFIESLPQDRALANKIQQDWNKQIDDMIAKHSGNYAKAGKDIIGLMSNIKKQYNPGGQAHAITTNLQTYKDWLSRHQERVAKGEVLAGDMNLANEYFMKNYTGVGEIDPVSGTFNRINVEDLATFKDPDSVIQKVLPGFKPEKHKVGESYVGNDGMIHYRERETEGLNPQRLYQGFAPALTSDAELNAYYGQKAKFLGMDPNQVAQGLDDYAKQRAMSLSYMNTSDIHKMQRDPAYIARLKASLDRDNIDYQYGLQQYGLNVPGSSLVDDGGIRMNHDDWRSPTNSSLADAIFGLPSGTAFGPYQTASKAPSIDPSLSSVSSLKELITDPKHEAKLRDRNIDPRLARAFWEGEVKRAGPEFAKRYGTDPKYTQKFEKDFVYNLKNEYDKNHRYYRTVENEIPDTQAHNKALHKAIQLALTKGSTIYLPGNPVGQQSVPDDIMETFYDDKKEQLKNLAGLRVTTVKPQRGINTAGYMVHTPKGSFVVEDPAISRSNLGNELKEALFPMHYGTSTVGGRPIAIERDPKTGEKVYTVTDASGKQHMTYPVLDYIYDDQTGTVKEFYGYTTNPKDPFNNRVLGPDKQPLRYTYDQIDALYNQDFQGMFGTGATKSSHTWYNFNSGYMPQQDGNELYDPQFYNSFDND